MENITYQEIELLDGVKTFVIINRGNGEFTSMLKSDYEAQKVEHLTEIPTK